jgi:hypothetical protein
LSQPDAATTRFTGKNDRTRGPHLAEYRFIKGVWLMDVETVSRRVLSEFAEMPGMALTPRQASLLFGLDQDFCRVVLDALVDAAYLRQRNDGAITLGHRVAA